MTTLLKKYSEEDIPFQHRYRPGIHFDGSILCVGVHSNLGSSRRRSSVLGGNLDGDGAWWHVDPLAFSSYHRKDTSFLASCPPFLVGFLEPGNRHASGITHHLLAIWECHFG